MPIIMKDGIAYSSGSQTQEMKLAEYLALDPSEINNDTIYFITDANEELAKNITYDNTNSRLTATDMQDAIDEVVIDRLSGLNFAQDSEGNWGYIPSGADSVIPFKKGYENTPATATAGTIAKGETAWVNGELITGTAIIVDPSAGYVILNSSNVDTGKELTGGWNPSGEFGISYGNKLSTVSTINRIDLTNVSKIVFKYQFSDLASYNTAEYITENPYFKYYLTDISGNNVKSTTIYAKDKKAGTFEATMNVNDLSGTYNISYVLNSYWKEQDVGDYEKTYGAATRIKTIILY